MTSKTVTFQLEGSSKVYTLSFDFNSVCEAEERSKCNLMTALAAGGISAEDQGDGVLYAFFLRALADGGISASQIRGLLFALLRPSEPNLTLADAGWLLSQNMPLVLDAMNQALKHAREEEDPAAVQTPGLAKPEPSTAAVETVAPAI